MTHPVALGAKFVSYISKKLNLGNGSTWPGHLALSIRPNIISDILSKSDIDIVLVVGTNGKTTTAKILATILEENQESVIQNTSGANLLNGIASTLLLHTNTQGGLSESYGIFEVDENNLPIVLSHLTPKIIIALDLFRDQLDRYGELDSIAKKWNTAFRTLDESTTLVLNADDPLISYLAKDVKAKVVYFGMPDKEKGQKRVEHASDSLYCPNCGHKLVYTKVFFSHLGMWHCENCGIKRPLPMLSEISSPLPGAYNIYNTLAASLSAKELGIKQDLIEKALQKVQPAFGRQEKITFQNKSVQIFLSKNPTSMNQSLATVFEQKAKYILLVLNDRIPDGRDISWIWDIDIENFKDQFKRITVSGDRAYDMTLRLRYADFKNFSTESDLKMAIQQAVNNLPDNETLYILPTYSAMLDVRKIVTGRKIL